MDIWFINWLITLTHIWYGILYFHFSEEKISEFQAELNLASQSLINSELTEHLSILMRKSCQISKQSWIPIPN